MPACGGSRRARGASPRASRRRRPCCRRRGSSVARCGRCRPRRPARARRSAGPCRGGRRGTAARRRPWARARRGCCPSSSRRSARSSSSSGREAAVPEVGESRDRRPAAPRRTGSGSAASSRNRSSTSEATAAHPMRGGAGYPVGATAGARRAALERGGDELAEERRRPGRARLELRVELRRDEPRVIGQLDDLDEAALLERAADDEARVDQLLAVGVVHLVAVAVPLGDHGLAAVRPRGSSSRRRA